MVEEDLKIVFKVMTLHDVACFEKIYIDCAIVTNG